MVTSVAQGPLVLGGTLHGDVRDHGASVAQVPLVLGGTLHGGKCGTVTIGIGGNPPW